MLEITRRNRMFRIKEVWFDDYPHDVDGCHRVVFCDCKNKADGSGFDCKRQAPTLVIDLTQDLDVIWGKMNRGSCRQPILKAEKEGIEVKWNHDCDEFYKMYCSIARVKGLSSLRPLEVIKKHGTLFVAEYNCEIISGICYLEDKNTMRALVAGSKRFDGDMAYASRVARATKLIVWRALTYAKDRGIREFDMGGYYTEEVKDEQREGVNIFKRRFGGELTMRYVYQKDYSAVYKLARRVCRLKRNLIECKD